MATTTSANVGSVEPAPTTITVTYTENDDGWITAQVVEYPGAISQGPTRHEAWVNVIGALRDLTHEPTTAERVAFTVQARIVEPVAGLRHRLAHRGNGHSHAA